MITPEALGPTITIGEILVEIMATTQGHGFLAAQPLFGPYASGAPAIFIDQVAKLGGAAGIIGCVGQDDFGLLCTRRLAADGVDVSAIALSRHRPTGSAFVRYRPDGGRDFVFNLAQSAAGEISLTPAAAALIARAGHLHVMGSAQTIPAAWPVLEQALATVKRRGGSVSFDPNLRKELLSGDDILARFRQVLGVTDLFLPSEDEIFLATTARDLFGAVAELRAAGVAEIVLKCGKDGAWRFSAAGEVHAPGFAVPEVDPTGAGDCFGAAYVTTLRLGQGAEAALRLANAAGARNVTRQGPMEGTSTLAELHALIGAQT